MTQKSGLEAFDAVCDEWERAHVGVSTPYGELFADWLAGLTGQVVIGGPVGEAPSVVAIPEGASYERHQQ